RDALPISDRICATSWCFHLGITAIVTILARSARASNMVRIDLAPHRVTLECQHDPGRDAVAVARTDLLRRRIAQRALARCAAFVARFLGAAVLVVVQHCLRARAQTRDRRLSSV